MRILFTGATGVLGRAAVPQLVGDSHDVIAVSRSAEDAVWLEKTGARPEPVDLFDPSALDRSVAGVDTVVHFATAIPPMSTMTKRQSWETNDRLRSQATGILVDAAIANDVSRFVQQSVTFAYRDGGVTWLDEDSVIDPGWDVLDSAFDAEAHLDRFRRAGGTRVTLRLSRLYGPGRASGDFVAGVEPTLPRGNGLGAGLPVGAGGIPGRSRLLPNEEGSVTTTEIFERYRLTETLQT